MDDLSTYVFMLSTYPEDGSTKLLRNTSTRLPFCKASYPRRQTFSSAQLCLTHIWISLLLIVFYWHVAVPCYCLLPGIHFRNKFLAGNGEDMRTRAVKTCCKNNNNKKHLKVYATQWKLLYLVWDVGCIDILKCGCAGDWVSSRMNCDSVPFDRCL